MHPGPIRSLFLIDDDRIFNMIHTRIMESKSFAQKIQPFHNAKQALKALRDISTQQPEDFPEMIFLDINMPAMDGWEFLEEFEKLPGQIQIRCNVIILTSSIDPRDIERSRTYKNVTKFMSKPLTPEMLSSLSA
jgi:CheY-like chemotaxis protein